jgi:hypothetical protein
MTSPARAVERTSETELRVEVLLETGLIVAMMDPLSVWCGARWRRVMPRRVVAREGASIGGQAPAGTVESIRVESPVVEITLGGETAEV